jgi:hypothetical protein
MEDNASIFRPEDRNINFLRLQSPTRPHGVISQHIRAGCEGSVSVKVTVGRGNNTHCGGRRFHNKGEVEITVC